eukprot:TRINITY_DN17909_c0_g1_i1.p1 TRINITY_DN17909_c0_g1~~TRINITY_DN17909_c0_g1_i1.p1  ORF type:complete len:299 (+),score=43.12 TRINITY_DN17909_c0_g1_i1:33-929(+)
MENDRVSLPRLALILALCILYRLWVLKNTNIDGRMRAAVDFSCLAETYGSHYDMRLSGAVILVLSGDVLPPVPEAAGPEWYKQEVRRLDQWLGSKAIRKKFRHRIVVWGDHDAPSSQAAPHYLENATVLFDNMTKVEGLTVYGTSWQPQNSEGAFYLPRGSPEMREKRDKIPLGVDVLVTHSAPLGMGDRKRYRTFEPSQFLEDSIYENKTYPLRQDPSIGDGLLYLKVTAINPRLVITGQHPEGYGRIRTPESRTVVLNPSITSSYKPASRPALFWSLIGPDTYPKNNGMDVPFVIE